MITTSFYNSDADYEDCEHDDYMNADDYDARRYERDGWNESQSDRQRF